MKLILSFILVLAVLAIGVSQVEAYEGQITFDSEISDITIGDIVTFKGMLIGVEPNPNDSVNIKLIDNNGIVMDEFQSPIDTQMTLFEGTEETWNFQFSIDTAKYNLSTDVEYIIQVSYEDKSRDFSLFVYPTLEQSIIDAGNAKTSNSQLQTSIVQQPIPDWVRNIFVFYANGDISDQDLLNAIQYLIDIKILNP